MEVLPDARPPLEYVFVVEAAVFDGAGNVALVRNRGAWWLPGGRRERGETIYEAAVRKVAEETGLDVKARRIVGVTEHMTDKHVVFVTVQCDLAGGSARCAKARPEGRRCSVGAPRRGCSSDRHGGRSRTGLWRPGGREIHRGTAQ